MAKSRSKYVYHVYRYDKQGALIDIIVFKPTNTSIEGWWMQAFDGVFQDPRVYRAQLLRIHFNWKERKFVYWVMEERYR